MADSATTPKETTKKGQPERDNGFFVNTADWLLSRLPWFKTRYEQWSHAKRVIVGFLMYLIVLPVIPIAVAIAMYLRDPEGFKKGNAKYVLGAIIALWLGGFGAIAAQPATVSSPDTTNVSSDAEKAVRDKKQSAPTNGRQFKNCDAAFKAGVFNIPKSDPSYAKHLDGDNDGVACEKK
ncbi:hypothetical protein CR970_03725 [Candidatus Saccharibacteria bacterium]|nr:MAG: hypothetical protein CR970_03725 [Candidatus Saccharibacteria bacterium]